MYSRINENSNQQCFTFTGGTIQKNKRSGGTRQRRTQREGLQNCPAVTEVL